MATRAPRICSCGLKVAYGATCVCRKRCKAQADRARPGARQRGYDTKWERESKAFLARPENRYCACGCGRLADMVDHKIAHKGDMHLFWNRANWQPMNRRCNSSKAARKEGGFGNPSRGVVDNFAQGSPDRAGWPTRDTSGFSRPGSGKIGEPGR